MRVGRHTDDLWEQMLANFDNTEQFYFAGGEPIIMEEHAQYYFNMPIKQSPYMQYVFHCKQPDKYPAIVHKDGTSRVQTVKKKQHFPQKKAMGTLVLQ